MITATEITKIVDEAQTAAADAAARFFQERLGGVDQCACGFAWVDIFRYNGEKIRGNTKIGRAMKQAGVRQDYRNVFQIWNPSRFPCQNVDTLEAGAQAAADVWRKYGFEAYASSRLD